MLIQWQDGQKPKNRHLQQVECISCCSSDGCGGHGTLQFQLLLPEHYGAALSLPDPEHNAEYTSHPTPRAWALVELFSNTWKS